ncbi:hypothetical protein V7083_16090, partial [Bacillus sp. JJ1764]
NKDKKWLFVLFFVVLTLILEWLISKVGLMKSDHWKTWWSAPFYFIGYRYYLPWQLKFIRK